LKESNSEKKHPVYVTVEHSRKFMNFLVFKHGEILHFERIQQGKKHPIYVTVEYSRKFWNFLVLKHGEINQTSTTW